MKNLIDICDYVWKRIILRHRDFPDGWMYKRDLIRMCGRITTDELSKRSKGFCGYDWMITSIIKYGEIKCRKEWDKK